jgi:protein involved in polysaccharide export with SLBB domain
VRRRCCFIGIFFTLTIGAFPQNSLEEAVDAGTVTRNTLLALSSPEYPVTAGDIYTLAYAAGGTEESYRIVVDSSYRIRISNLGLINAAGKSYRQLKTEAEAVVSNNYPLSGAQLVLTRPAFFKVAITGEVRALEERTAWALARLSSVLDLDLFQGNGGALGSGGGTVNTYTGSGAGNALAVYAGGGGSGGTGSGTRSGTASGTGSGTASGTVPGLLTAYASIRDITITSRSGESRTCDLFKALREGDLSQDPYLRPGDTIRVNRLERAVTVEGAVERPGEYQLLPGEHLGELIARYASGLLPTADLERIELVRYVEGEAGPGDKRYLSGADIEGNYPLQHLDAVTVPSVLDLLPVMFVEGAVQDSLRQENTLQIGERTNASNRITVRFNRGENYASLLRRNAGWFTAISDTRNAYIIRGEERIPLNINPLLYDADYRSPYFVEREDVLIIPFRQYFVTVAGAVAAPGRYPYIPDRTWDYYVALAGGFVKERNSFESVVIKDLAGKRMGKGDAITPETTITARTNAGLYYFNQYAPVITTILSIITTFISVTLLINR